VLKTSEEYNNLRTGLANIMLTVNTLTDDGFVLVNGKKKVKLKFYLGDDYKLREIFNIS